MKTILLKFAGPLQSWGTKSHFETRMTDFYPSKSAVIGMIAGALGYRRDEDVNIQKLNELLFAVRVDQPGRLLKDFHNAHKYKDNGTLDRNYVTNRYYLEDAIFVVAIASADSDLIEMIYQAFKYPYFQLFMGRRAVPVTADFIIEDKIFDENPIDLLEKYNWQASRWYKKERASYGNNQKENLEIYADSELLDENYKEKRQDRVISFSQKNRQFGFRYEARKIVTVGNLEVKTSNSITNHDAYDAI